MRYRSLALSWFPLVLVAHAAITANTLNADQAKSHVGENATVCGVVGSTHYAGSSEGSPTFVNLDKPYPNQLFTILIWGEDIPKFSLKPATWEGKRVCATGTIASYRGSPEIVTKSPRQISIGESKN